jgi:hypothetical protein
MRNSSEGIMTRLTRGLALAVLFCAPLLAGGISSGPQELGIVVLKKLEIREGKVIIMVDSGGCTDKTAIKANVQEEEGITKGSPRYVVTFERVRVDDCKALLLDGTVLEYDLAEELGIDGNSTLSVTNGVSPRSMDAITAENALKRELAAAMIRAIGRELRGTEEKLKTALNGIGPAGNVEKFKNRIAELKGQLVAYQQMNPYDFVLGTAKEEGPEAFFEKAEYGPVTPARKRTVSVMVKEPYQEGADLEVEGATKSGPFYHLAGIAKGAYGRLKPGRQSDLVLYLLYKREYFSQIPDYYVYLAEVK